jgi:hypothetical protein
MIINDYYIEIYFINTYITLKMINIYILFIALR